MIKVNQPDTPECVPYATCTINLQDKKTNSSGATFPFILYKKKKKDKKKAFLPFM